MRRAGIYILVAGVAAMVTVARGGHELPVYPSYYPHQIEIRTLAPQQAATELESGAIQAYVGSELGLAGVNPDQIRPIESLGSFVVLRVNPDSALSRSEETSCAALKGTMHALGEAEGMVVHPYPVTPMHGDYLYHADLASAAEERFSGDQTGPGVKVKASARFVRNHAEWTTGDADWDVEVSEVDAANLVASAMLSMDGRLGPPWLKAGWFHAHLLLADAIEDPARKEAITRDRHRLESGDFGDLVERVNLERELVSTLTAGCRKVVGGYTLKREYINVEYTAGIENVGYDSITGLRSPMFIRTVKLKDFPWNGWLKVGDAGAPASAWNPIAGMNDPSGRLLGFAVTDPVLLPSPYDAGWMLNRISDLPVDQGR